MTQNQNKPDLYAENLYIAQGISYTATEESRIESPTKYDLNSQYGVIGEPKTITEALLDAWFEFNQDIKSRSPDYPFVDNYARIELFKMMVDLETDKARTSI